MGDMDESSGEPFMELMNRNELGLASLDVKPRPLVADVAGVLACPITCLTAWWCLEPRTEAIVLHCGELTGKVKESGIQFTNPCGREIRTISTAQVSLELQKSKVTDSAGNPILVSAVVTYRFEDAPAALLNVRDPDRFVLDQASSSLKAVVGHYSYHELKQESSGVSKELVEALQYRVLVAGAKVYS